MQYYERLSIMCGQFEIMYRLFVRTMDQGMDHCVPSIESMVDHTLHNMITAVADAVTDADDDVLKIKH